MPDPAKDAAVRDIFTRGGMHRLPDYFGPNANVNFNRAHGYSDYSGRSDVFVRENARSAYESTRALCPPHDACDIAPWRFANVNVR